MASALTFLREVIEELRRVTWPSWGELYRYTLVVIATVVIIGTFIALVDLGVAGALQRFVYLPH